MSDLKYIFISEDFELAFEVGSILIFFYMTSAIMYSYYCKLGAYIRHITKTSYKLILVIAILVLNIMNIILLFLSTNCPSMTIYFTAQGLVIVILCINFLNITIEYSHCLKYDIRNIVWEPDYLLDDEELFLKRKRKPFCIHLYNIFSAISILGIIAFSIISGIKTKYEVKNNKCEYIPSKINIIYDIILCSYITLTIFLEICLIFTKRYGMGVIQKIISFLFFLIFLGSLLSLPLLRILNYYKILSVQFLNENWFLFINRVIYGLILNILTTFLDFSYMNFKYVLSTGFPRRPRRHYPEPLPPLDPDPPEIDDPGIDDTDIEYLEIA